MASINKVQLLGNLTRDPEIKETANGKLARLSVATNRRYRDRESGEMKDSVQYHDVVVFQEQIVNVIENYCQKGSEVYVEGSLEHRTYEDRDGNRKYITEVIIRPYGGEFQLGRKPNSSDADGDERDAGNSRGSRSGGGRDNSRGGYDNSRNDRGGNNRNDNRNQGSSRNQDYDDMDDDIPF